jgi:hypothetical protein
MSKQLYGLENWVLDEDVSNAKRFALVNIHLQYPDDKLFVEFKPKERIKKINEYLQGNFNRLICLDLFAEYALSGTKKRPRGVKAKINFGLLKKLLDLDYLSGIWIESVEHATFLKTEELSVDKYYCVKMTLVAEIEGILLKKQKIEKRFVMIKASSFDDAYEKIERRRDDYTVSFLNPNGRFVRWRVDSFDDCYETNIINPDDIAQPNGIEVFSALKSRKNKSKAAWNGNF